MTRSFRLAALTAVTSMAAGLLCLPGTAYAADTEATLTAAEMVSALKAVAGSSTAAASDGWRITESLSSPSASASGEYAVDPAAGVAYEHDNYGGALRTKYAVHHRGTYETLSTAAARAAVTMMNRPAVRYVVKPDAALDLDRYVDTRGFRPSELLTKDVSYAGTRTAHDDGTADYTFSPETDTTITFVVTAEGVLSGARVAAGDVTGALAFTYGAQNLTAPAPSATITSVVLARGEAYLSMAATVKKVVGDGATTIRRAAAGHTVKATSLRKVVRSLAGAANKRAGSAMVRVEDIGNGARVYATNPWTHQTVAYTVTASGSEVVVQKR
ncbi:hypothetical protein AB0368_36295 [Actinoplanes sp. NPDC051475]|uniref:hypothetical protein n=1 Tax=Actinoplanes sp. NPDC051475 TaxID=3157225 RepID=UPI00344E4037